MKPYPFVGDRTFNIDAYLDKQLGKTVDHGHGASSTTFTPAEMAKIYQMPEPAPRFRGWAVRLNDRIERWMDTVDWPKWDIRAGNVCGFVLTGFILYLLFILADAIASGAIERAVRP